MALCDNPTVDLSETLRTIVSDKDFDDAQKVRAIEATIRQCNEERIIKELEKVNVYFAMITDIRI